MKVLALIFVGLAATSAAGVAQSAATVGWTPVAGTRARILSPVLGDQRQVGTIEAAAGDTLKFLGGDRRIDRWLRTSDITSVEVSSGTHTEKAKWAAIGFLVGAAAGAGLGAGTYTPPARCTDSLSCAVAASLSDNTGRMGATIGGCLIGALSGALIGTLWGSRQREIWTPVSAR
ncbi:MAG TPA: hypothetical protein VLJ83_04280 [Gemmatimonadaceae bacterium]|nr:hypothetical protein [Gemmatimonadaceae bacterium]